NNKNTKHLAPNAPQQDVDPLEEAEERRGHQGGRSRCSGRGHPEPRPWADGRYRFVVMDKMD
ncbi:hypothetical protein, partial [Amycolatopsis lurida]|uniref:hypothetical protein n=1 Tax=Amycolatopsis lurida TaxID=31959 RepID=UPI00366174C0